MCYAFLGSGWACFCVVAVVIGMVLTCRILRVLVRSGLLQKGRRLHNDYLHESLSNDTQEP